MPAQLKRINESIMSNKRLKPIDFKKPEAISTLIEDTINQIRFADEDVVMDLKKANTIAVLTGKLIQYKKILMSEQGDAKSPMPTFEVKLTSNDGGDKAP